MEFLMQFLRFLEKIRNPVFDFFFSLITHIGEETVFLVIALLFFWCIDKYRGYFILLTGLIGTVVNQALKLVFRIPRPWVYDPDFTIVEAAREEATGYSFPSGHTQNAAGTFGAIARTSRKKSIIISALVIIFLVGLSRMYLGVHTLLDVGVSIIIAAALVLGLYPFFKSDAALKKSMPYIATISILISIALVLFVFLLPEEGIDPHNLYSGRKNGATLLGCILGLPIIYYVDEKYTQFSTRGAWYSQIIKFVFGLLGVLAIKSGLSKPLVALFGNEFIARGVRYFLIVIFAGVIWPLAFKFFEKLKIGALDRFGERVTAFFKKDKKTENCS